TIRITLTDETGSPWRADLIVRVITDPPTVQAGADTAVFLGDTLTLQGKAQDKSGFVTKWEWDIGGTGNFKEAPGGSIHVKAADSVTDMPCILKVTDDDGE